MSVYKVIEHHPRTSPTSWGQAAAEAVQRARDSVDDIRVARVIEQDMAVDSTSKIYRIKLSVVQDEAGATATLAQAGNRS